MDGQGWPRRWTVCGLFAVSIAMLGTTSADDLILQEPVPLEWLNDADLNDVHFIDPQNGWAVGQHGTILRTTDGGVTWQTATVRRVLISELDSSEGNVQ